MDSRNNVILHKIMKLSPDQSTVLAKVNSKLKLQKYKCVLWFMGTKKGQHLADLQYKL